MGLVDKYFPLLYSRGRGYSIAPDPINRLWFSHLFSDQPNKTFIWGVYFFFDKINLLLGSSPYQPSKINLLLGSSPN